ncbi:hypothetical protein AGMMS49940_15360 [Spirochaetia bacterium]|nr:hypothetical protein AGMMS49940_15360 [Spirochaetia bacterium]
MRIASWLKNDTVAKFDGFSNMGEALRFALNRGDLLEANSIVISPNADITLEDDESVETEDPRRSYIYGEGRW